MSDPEPSLDKLMSYQQEVCAEEQWLKKMIAKLNDQIHALQVEQLHIVGAINKSRTNTPNEALSSSQIDLKNEAPESQELDLTVPNYKYFEEDEDDEMEE